MGVIPMEVEKLEKSKDSRFLPLQSVFFFLLPRGTLQVCLQAMLVLHRCVLATPLSNHRREGRQMGARCIFCSGAAVHGKQLAIPWPGHCSPPLSRQTVRQRAIAEASVWLLSHR